MNHKELEWKCADGIEIYGRLWAPNNISAKAVICIVHGMGEHSGRYQHLADYFTANGFNVLAYDQRGHGKSGGSRGHTPSYQMLLNGIDDLLSQADKLFPGKNIFLYGHSLGGNLVLNYVLRKKHKIAGVIAASPWLRLAYEPPAIKVFLSKMMNNIYPGLTQKTEMDISALSRDKAVLDAFRNDPLVHDKISARMFLSIYASGLWALEHAAEMQLPLLICHGSEDRLTSAEASKEFAGKIKGDVTMKLWQGLYHETHNEPEKSAVLNFIRDWVEKHIIPIMFISFLFS